MGSRGACFSFRANASGDAGIVSEVAVFVCSDALRDQESAWRLPSPKTNTETVPFSPNQQPEKATFGPWAPCRVIAGKGQASAGDNIADSKGQVRDRFSASISICDGPRFGGGTVLLVADGRAGVLKRDLLTAAMVAAVRAVSALEVPLDVGGWAVHGAGSFQESKAAMSPNAQADRSIIQSPLHHGFRCTMTESATLAVKDLRRRLILVPKADHRLRPARHW